MTEQYLTVGQTATLLNCSFYHVNLLAEKKILETHRLQEGGWVRVSRESVEQYAHTKGITLNFDLIQPRRRRQLTN